MRLVHIVCLSMLLESGLFWAKTPPDVRLKLGGETTLHVGQIAVLRLGFGQSYSVKLEGDVVVPLNTPQSERTHSYRAVRAGNASLLITPTDRKEGKCVDCVSRHCFLTVVP